MAVAEITLPYPPAIVEASALAWFPSNALPLYPPPPIDDPLANGIKTLFDPTIKQTTEKLLLVHRSQLELADELERLIARKSR